MNEHDLILLDSEQQEIEKWVDKDLKSIDVIQCCKSDSELLKASFKKGDTVLLDNSQKVIYIEDLRNYEIMLRHIAGYKFIVNASRVSSL
jgi:hypothetical protein